MEEKIRIIRTASGSMPAWGLINELINNGFDVIGVDSNPLSFALYMLEESFVIPRGNEPGFIDAVIKIAENEKVKAIISGPEEELIPLSKNKDLFEKKGICVLCPDYESVSVCADKLLTHNFFVGNNIPSPRNFPTVSEAEFPCIVKPRFGRGGENVYVARNLEELTFYIKRVNEPIVQEFIDGEEYTIDILTDRAGNAISVVPRIRINTESGVSVKGKTVKDKELIIYSRQIVKELKLFGPSNIQCIKNSNGVKFLEINTRFGGGSILSIKADDTIIPNLKKIIRGEETEYNGNFKEGIIMLRYHSEIYLDEQEIKAKA